LKHDINFIIIKNVEKASFMVLTAIGPSILSNGTFGKTTDPSVAEYTSTSEQSIPLR
jgi:hypothetical protein